LCNQLPKKDLLTCNNNKIENTHIKLGSFFTGCLQGVFSSVENTISFLWEILSSLWKEDSVTDNQEDSSTFSMVKSYLAVEYQKAKDTSTLVWPLNHSQAIGKMAPLLGKMLYQGVSEVLTNEIDQLSCLNEKAKTNLTCQLATDLFTMAIPPSGAFIAILKLGKKAKLAMPRIRKATLKIRNKITKRRQESVQRYREKSGLQPYAKEMDNLMSGVADSISALKKSGYNLKKTYANLKIGETIKIAIPRNERNPNGLKFLTVSKNKSGKMGIKVE